MWLARLEQRMHVYMCVGTHSPLYYPLYLSNITFHWDMLEVGYARLSLL